MTEETESPGFLKLLRELPGKESEKIESLSGIFLVPTICFPNFNGVEQIEYVDLSNNKKGRLELYDRHLVKGEFHFRRRNGDFRRNSAILFTAELSTEKNQNVSGLENEISIVIDKIIENTYLPLIKDRVNEYQAEHPDLELNSAELELCEYTADDIAHYFTVNSAKELVHYVNKNRMVLGLSETLGVYRTIEKASEVFSIILRAYFENGRIRL